MSRESSGTVGQRLQVAREQAGASLRDIADRTRISVMALEALERDDVKRLPGGIFTRSFVRAYAAEVGLNPDELVKDFLEQFGEAAPNAGTSRERFEDPDAVESERQIARSALRLAAVSVPIAGLVIYLGLRSPAEEPVEPDVSTIESPQLARAESPTERPAQELGPPAGAETERESERPPSSAAAVTGEAGLLLVLEPRGDCWFSMSLDGAPEQAELVAGGDRREFRAERQIVVTLGDAGACAYSLNGVEGRPLGDAGQVVTRRITPDNLQTYLAP